MNELAKSFDARGLTIVGVTSEDKEPTEQWIDKHGVQHAYAYDPKGKLSRLFGVKGIPHAVLVDPGGTVVWSGHPAGLDESTIESALAGALTTPLWTWPEEATATRLHLTKRAYAQALAAAKTVDGPHAELVQGLISARLEAVRAAAKAGDYRRAVAAAEHAARDLEGLPEGDEARTLLREIQADPRVLEIIAGQRALAGIQERIAVVRLVVEAEGLLKELAALRDEHPGTIVARRAEVEIQGLRKRMP